MDDRTLNNNNYYTEERTLHMLLIIIQALLAVRGEDIRSRFFFDNNLPYPL